MGMAIITYDKIEIEIFEDEEKEYDKFIKVINIEIMKGFAIPKHLIQENYLDVIEKE